MREDLGWLSEGTTDFPRTVSNVADANPDSGASEQLIKFVKR